MRQEDKTERGETVLREAGAQAAVASERLLSHGKGQEASEGGRGWRGVAAGPTPLHSQKSVWGSGLMYWLWV